MATGPNPQFRFVRCPKCGRVLPEVPNVPVYRCGGCGALLQAKSPKKDAERRESGEQESMVSGDKEANRLNPEAKPSSSNCSVDYNNDEDQNCCKAVDFSSSETHKSGDFGSEDCDMEGPAIESEAYSSTELVHNGPKDSWPFAGRLSSEARATEEEANHESDCAEANGNLLSESEGRASSAVAADVPLRESTLSVPVSPPRERSHGAVVQGFGSMRSIGTSAGATEYASPESEFSCIHRDESKSYSPTGIGSRAYDGSISSYDGQLPERYAHALRTSHHQADKLRRGQFLVDSMSSINSHQPKTKLYDMSEKGWDRPPRNLARAERKDKVPLHRTSFQGAGYGSGSSFSSQVWDSGLHSSGKLEYQRQEKMKLLRMIRELQDQLDSSCNLEGSANVGATTWKEQNIPSCYDHGVVRMEATWHEPRHSAARVGYNAAQQSTFARTSFSGEAPKSRTGCSAAQQSACARMSFSGEAPNSRHHIGRPCLHCHPQDWKHSAPMPPALCHRNGLCTGVPSGYACCNPESSYGSSPQRYIDSSEFSEWSREIKSGDQRLKDHVLRKYTREKPVVAKKHFRPKAGGAPFVTCYRCSKLLLLPEDFLLFKKRYYKLRCGACSTVLKFSVQNRTQIFPYSPNVVGLDPPPSEADESSGVMNRRSVASSKHPYSCPHSKPSCKSCSIKGDNFSRDRKMSNAPMEKRKELIQNRFQDKYKDPVEEAYRPASSKPKLERLSSRTQVQRSNSPLHRLMGYSSPSLVVRGIGMSPADTSS